MKPLVRGGSAETLDAAAHPLVLLHGDPGRVHEVRAAVAPSCHVPCCEVFVSSRSARDRHGCESLSRGLCGVTRAAHHAARACTVSGDAHLTRGWSGKRARVR